MKGFFFLINVKTIYLEASKCSVLSPFLGMWEQEWGNRHFREQLWVCRFGSSCRHVGTDLPFHRGTKKGRWQTLLTQSG